jgi:hypothetical protein
VVANSSEASRIALTTMGQPGHGRSLAGNVNLFLDYGRRSAPVTRSPSRRRS